MAVFHDEVEIEDFQYDEDSETYFYPCPCGDNFCITKEDLENGEDVATCPSCSLIIKVIYDKNQTRVSTSAAVRRDCGLKAGDRALRLLSGIPGLSPLGASGSPQYVNPKHLYTLPDVPKDTSNTSFPPPIETPVLEQEGCFQRLRTWSLMLTVDPCQSPLSVGFSRQEYWSELPCPPPEGLPDPGIKSTSLTSPALAGSVHVWRDSPSPFHQQRTS
ncbi:diphthamide biosynthesis protein 3 isoform X2 [Bos taurus]|uniref:diphthamide biosynthesis protein 3 isoform X2 n=1 Tax=Bos taurus TaxID=9913 RepID=UPI0028CB17A5|nr:diphthamide biosynthesis protein 3 isoform X2 [Bos taurus]